MESEGILELYERSVKKYNIRCNYFIGVGDNSSYSTEICVFAEKQECVNHPTKRMGSNLQALIQDYKGEKLSIEQEISRTGCLTVVRINAIQNF